MSSFIIDDRTTTALGWSEVLQHLSRRCQTDRGHERALALPFLDSASDVQRRLELVAEARRLHDRAEPLPFGAISDLRPALRRLDKEGVLDGETLRQVAETLRAGARLRRFLRGRVSEAPGLAGLASTIAPLEDVAGPIGDSFDERGELADHASPELGRLRQRALECHARLTRRMRALMEEPYIAKFLQDTFYTQREDRYVLPIRTDAGSAVKGIVHGSSTSGATLWVEPEEVVGINNDLKVAEMEVAREVARIYAELSRLVREERTAIQSNLDGLERLDVLDAMARLAGDLGAHPVRVGEQGDRIQLQAMRHPLMVLSERAVVANDLEIDELQTLIITGPNAGGKTVTLKTAGLCALMLRAGMHLPVGPDSSLPLYDAVLTEMGDDQSLEQDLSTFTAHLSHLMAFLRAAGPGTLILLDEVGIGTDPGEGAALAQALLEALLSTGAQVLATTHYERLKSLAVADPRFANASVGFDVQSMAPTYRLHLGTPGSSGALAVARRVGLAGEIVDRATELLDQGGGELTRLLEALAGERTKLEAQRRELERATAEAQSKASELQAETGRLKRREKEVVEAEQRAALSELKRARQDLERVRALLRCKPDEERLRQADRQITRAADKIRQHETRPAAEGRTPAPEDLVPGTRVVVQRLGGTGEVIEPPSRGKVMVRVGGIRTQVRVADVLLPKAAAKGAAKPRQAQRRPPAPSAPEGSAAPDLEETHRAPVRTAYNTVDVRGKRVDEALAEVDKFLDDALRSGERVLLVIHGHGTGAVRAAVREQLAASGLVDRFHPAPLEDGGDGVTVVWMD